MVVIRVIFAALVGLVLHASSGCGTLPIPPNVDSGISGIVQAGPTCPVVQPGLDCDDRPIVATIVVRDAALGLEVTRFTSDSAGMFRAALLPGTYVLDPQPNDCCIGGASPQTIEVQTGQFTTVVIAYDTGIR